MKKALRPLARAASLVTLASSLAACAQAPVQPTSSLPMSVIVNDPGKHKHDPRPTDTSSAVATTSPVAPVFAEPPLHDEQVTPIRYSDVLERVRQGMSIPDVDHPWVTTEYNWYVRHPAYLNRVFDRSSRYLHYIVGEVDRRGMPLELALLPVVESAFNPFAYSPSRAAGLWQFIAPTGQHFGLKQNWWQDQRRDVIESTRAALDYLTFLRNTFDGDWLLAVAAYNHGSLNVRRAIDRNRAAGKPTDFFSLPIPAETRAYVPKLLAIARLVRNADQIGVQLPAIADAPYFRVVDTNGPVDLRHAAALAGLDIEELHALNPAHHRWATDPSGPHRLLVPSAISVEFDQRIASLSSEERMQLAAHTVKRGETAAAIANRHKLTAAALADLNGGRLGKLSAGDEIWVPASGVAAPRSGLSAQVGDPPKRGRTASTGVKRVTVKSGDSLWTIAKRNGLSTAQLAKLNGISTKATLKPGQRLVVGRGGPTTDERVARAASRPPQTAPLTAAVAMPVSNVTAPTEVAPLVEDAPAAAQAPAAEVVTRELQYKVRKGDTLYSIARRFEVSVGQLQAWNGLRGSNLRHGQTLTVFVDGRRDFGG